jgi:hypothetical protein
MKDERANRQRTEKALRRALRTIRDKQEDLALMRWEDEGGPCVSA